MLNWLFNTDKKNEIKIEKPPKITSVVLEGKLIKFSYIYDGSTYYTKPKTIVYIKQTDGFVNGYIFDTFLSLIPNSNVRVLEWNKYPYKTLEFLDDKT